MNYTADLLLHLKKDMRMVKHKQFLTFIGGFIDALSRAQIFKLPEDGILLQSEYKPGEEVLNIVKKFDVPLRLPYKEIIIEFPHTMEKGYTKHGWTKSVCIATQVQESDAPEILRGSNLDIILLTSAFFSTDTRTWVINPSALYCTIDGFYPYSPLGIEIGVDDILNDNAQEGQALMMLLTALACSNVKTQIVLPPDALNKKRIRNNKPPFRSHHILVIGDKPTNKTTGDGSHASPRQHLRRGHIRRLENKNVWVNACVVGSSANGIVTKDYSIKKRINVS